MTPIANKTIDEIKGFALNKIFFFEGLSFELTLDEDKKYTSAKNTTHNDITLTGNL